MISPPIPLNPFIPAIRDGFAFSIGFVDLEKNPDLDDAERPPEKPWMAMVHELPSGANIWLKHYETQGKAIDDALGRGLLTATTAETLRLSCCVKGRTIIFTGITKHPDLSLSGFEHFRIASEANWETFKSTLRSMLFALAPVTEATQ